MKMINQLQSGAQEKEKNIVMFTFLDKKTEGSGLNGNKHYPNLMC
jgi:hypothetical protein